MTSRQSRGGAPSRRRALGTYLQRRLNWSTELLFVFPLFVIYQVGTFSSDQLNGVDFVSTLLFRLSATSEWALLGLALAVMVGVGFLYARARQREQFELRRIWPVLLESGLYALFMGAVIVFVMTRVLQMHPPSLAAAQGYGPWMVLYISAGAGLHEELVFRVLIFGGLMALLTRYSRLSGWWILIAALAVSSVLFSASHHIPPHGEGFALFTFVYRVLAGVIFALIYRYRGFSTAVYTHFLYDVLVLGFWRG